jgi:metallo-beta-lactamase family protein
VKNAIHQEGNMKITLMGAAKCVTGSCTLIEVNNKKILVDCGMRQGKDAKENSSDEFGFDPTKIDVMFLTHAHIDHSGLVPLLIKKGYSGKVYCTGATARLCSIMFPDAAHVQEMEIEWENRKRARAGKPGLQPLYTVDEAKKATRSLSVIEYANKVTVMDGVTVRFIDAGHLLGSASIEIFIEEDGKKNKLVFSGDIGNKNIPIINDPVYINEADIVFMETTYGDRLHQQSDARKEFKETLIKALKAGGNIVIPSFAVGRTQELLYEISFFLQEKCVPGLEKVPVYIDSPLGIAATEIFRSAGTGYYDEEAMAYKAEGIEFFSFDTLRIAQTTDESKAINFDEHQKIIISSSGMCDAGRIKHHLKHNLWKWDSTVIFVGYQAVGTLGRSILDGAKNVKIFGEEIQVKANIVQIEGFSGHADRAGLLEWIGHFPTSVKKVLLMHGEEEVMKKFAASITALGYDAMMPEIFTAYDTNTFEKAGRGVSHIEKVLPESITIQSTIEKLKAKAASGSPAQAEMMKRELNDLIDKWDKEQTA